MSEPVIPKPTSSPPGERASAKAAQQIDDTGTITSDGQFAAHGPWRETLDEAEKDREHFKSVQQALSEAVRPYEALAEQWKERSNKRVPHNLGNAKHGKRAWDHGYANAEMDCANELLALSQPKGGEKV
jgi:hypothetical protein